ncbi:hypothetical protein [Microcoleus sp. OTE_8_concoct_300]
MRDSLICDRTELVSPEGSGSDSTSNSKPATANSLRLPLLTP